jgi:GTP 3',8-cyclase
MVSIASKQPTHRSATATTTLTFSSPQTHPSLLLSSTKKGDALAVARIAGIQAAKLTSTLIPLAHPSLQITFVGVDIEILAPTTSTTSIPSMPPTLSTTPTTPTSLTGRRYGGARIEARVDCEGKTGVEMEALTAASVAGLALYDMLKGVDKGMELGAARVLRKSGGKSGGWRWDGGSGKVVRDGEAEVGDEKRG